MKTIIKNIYDAVTNYQFIEAGKRLNEYRKKYGTKQLHVDINTMFSVRSGLINIGWGHILDNVLRKQVRKPQPSAWDLFLYYENLSYSTGFLLTLDCFDRLESQITNKILPSILSESILNLKGEWEDSFLSEKDRKVLSTLPLQVEVEDSELILLTMNCVRANLYVKNYWQKIGTEYLHRCAEELHNLEDLSSKPFVIAYMASNIIEGFSILCDWQSANQVALLIKEVSPYRYVLWQSYLLSKQSKIDEALEMLKKEEKALEESIQYWLQRSSLHEESKDFGEAKICLEKAISLNEQFRSKQSHSISLGFLLYKEGKIKEAIDIWQSSPSKWWQETSESLRQKYENNEDIVPYKNSAIKRIQQKPLHCGPCCLSIISQKWNNYVSQEQLAEKLSPWGSNLFKVGMCAEEIGFVAIFGERDFDLVKDTVCLDIPVLLDFNYPGGGHFVVAVGYDCNLDILEICDPSSVNASFITRRQFHERKSYTNYHTLVICPESETHKVPKCQQSAQFYYDVAETYYDTSISDGMSKLQEKYPIDLIDTRTLLQELRIYDFLRKNDVKSAFAVGKKVLQIENNSFYACSRLAEIFLNFNCIQEALECLHSVDKSKRQNDNSFFTNTVNTGNEYYHLIASKAHLKVGNLYQAILNLLISINVYAGRGEKFLLLAQIMEQLGEENLQLKYLDIAQQIAGPTVEAGLAQVYIYEKKLLYSEALEKLQSVIRDFPKRYDLYIDKGMIYEKIYNDDEAMKCFRMVIDRDSQWYLGYYHLIRICHQKKLDTASIVAEMDKNAEKTPNIYATKAWLYFKEQDYESCIREGQYAISLSPYHPWSNYLVSYSLDMLGRFDESLTFLEKIIQHCDSSNYYWKQSVHSLGKISRKIQDHARFDKIFQKAIEIAPDSHILWESLTDKLRIVGDTWLAKQQLQDLYSKVANKLLFAIEAGRLMADLQCLEEALIWFERVPEDNKHYADALLEICGILRLQKKYHEIIERLTTKKLSFAYVYPTLIKAYICVYQVEEAIICYKEGVKKFPQVVLSQSYYILNAIKSFGTKQQLLSLEEFYREGLNVEEEELQQQFWIYLAYTNDLLENIDKALEYAQQAVAKFPSSGEGWIVLADLYFQKNDFEQAVSAARKSCELRESTYPFQRLFQFLCALGNAQEAMQVCVTALKYYPGDLGFQKMMEDLVMNFQMQDEYDEVCEQLFPVVEDKALFLGNRASLHMEQGNYPKAKQLFLQALEFGEKVWFYTNLGTIYYQEQQFVKAEEMYFKVTNRNESYTYALKQLAYLYCDWYFAFEKMEKIHSKEALKEKACHFFEKVLSSDPDNVEVFESYIDFYISLDNVKKAQEITERIATTSNFSYDVFGTFASRLSSIGEIEKSLSYIERAVACPGEEHLKFWVYYLNGFLLKKHNKDFTAAEVLLKKSIECSPKYYHAYNELVDIYEKEESYGKVEELLRKVVWDSNDPRKWISRFVKCCCRLKNRDNLLQELMCQLKTLSPQVYFYCVLEVVKGLSKEWEHVKALKILDELSEHSYQDHISILQTRLDTLYNQRDYDALATWTKKTLQIDSNNLHALYYDAYVSLRSGDLEAGIAGLKKYYINGHGRNTNYIYQFAHTCSKHGHSDKFIDLCHSIYAISNLRASAHSGLVLNAFYECSTQKYLQLLEDLQKVDAVAKKEEYTSIVTECVDKPNLTVDEMISASKLLVESLKLAPSSLYVRGLLVGIYLYLENWDLADKYWQTLICEKSLSYWEYYSITRFVKQKYQNNNTEKCFEILQKLIPQTPLQLHEKYHLISVARYWNLDEWVHDKAVEIVEEQPKIKSAWHTTLFDETVEKRIDIAEKILKQARESALDEISKRQMETIFYAYKGDISTATKHAIATKTGHGEIFSSMCCALFKMEKCSEELCQSLFDCAIKYHEGHGSCTAWVLAILLQNDYLELFEKGMQKISLFKTDFTLSESQRNEIAACILALEYMKADKLCLEEKQEYQQQCLRFPNFRAILGIDLLSAVGF